MALSPSPPQVYGDVTVELELSSALREKSAAFCMRDLGCVAAILDAHNSKCPVHSVGPMDITNIQQDAFDLVMRQLEYDYKAFKVWQGKMKNYDSAPLSLALSPDPLALSPDPLSAFCMSSHRCYLSDTASEAVYHAKLSWTWEAKKQNRRAADAFLHTNCRLIHATSSEGVLREVQDFRKCVERQLQLDGGSVVPPRFGPAPTASPTASCPGPPSLSAPGIRKGSW